MAKGFLKLVMLKIISESENTGYQIIKRIGEITGAKPSTGSIYPMLKTMEVEGLITGRKTDDKTYYQITAPGKEKLKKLDTEKMGHILKIHQSISMARETFDDVNGLLSMHHLDLVGPLVNEIVELRNQGVERKKIEAILSRACKDLKKLKKEG